MAVRYTDGSTWSDVAPSLVSLFFEPEPTAGALLPPGSSRYAEGYAKRKMCVTIAFVGSDFQGMQLQSPPGVPWEAQPPTVEHELMAALHSWGGIAKTNFGELKKNSWSRSSRTDRGVHAVGCSVACKLIVPLAELSANGGHLTAATLEEINSHLPPTVRVVDAHRVNKGFSAQRNAEARQYCYYLPRRALRGRTVADLNAILRQYEGVMRVHNFMGNKGSGSVPGGGGSGRQKGGKKATSAELLFAEALAAVQEEPAMQEAVGRWPLLKEGTRTDDRMRREVFSMEATALSASGDAGEDDEGWLEVRVVGRSFVLNQIRKMLGGALFALWGDAWLPRAAFTIAQKGVFKMTMPMVPAECLMLEETCWREANAGNQGLAARSLAAETDGRADTEKAEAAQRRASAALSEFKAQRIVPEILRNTAVWEEWLSAQTERGGSIRWTEDGESVLVAESDWAALLAADAALESALAARGYAEALATTKKVKGVVQARGLVLSLATHFRLAPGAELNALVERAGKAIAEGAVDGEDVDAVVAFLQAQDGSQTA